MNKIILVGNPNTGKSTLFNTLTNSNAHTGNWHGVTVDEKCASLKIMNKQYTIVDLPGLYSLSPNSYEEEYTVNYILNNSKSKIICVCTNLTLKRNLLLCLELLQLNRQVVLVINNIDNNINVNVKKLSKILKIKILIFNVKQKKLVNYLKEIILKDEFYTNNLQFINLKYVNKYINKIKINLDANYKNFFINKAICGDEYYKNKLKYNIKTDEEYLELTIKQKFLYIDDILTECNYKQNKIVGKSLLDKIVLNKYLCIPIFILILTVIFYLTFFSIGAFLSEQLRFFIQDIVGESIVDFLKNCNISKWIVALIDEGVFGGVGTIFSFLPQVALLFIFLDILEQSGYISRLAFCLDDTLKVVGLSGRSVYTLLMGFGCSTTACLTARNMSDKNAKVKTAMLAPYMSCSAKLPVYSVIGGAFFGANNVFIIVLLYLLGIIVSLILSSFLEKTSLKSSGQTFIMEFPNYQKISLKQICKVCLDNIKTFLLRVGTVLFSLSIIVWLLQNFTFDFRYINNSSSLKSMLQLVGEFISPIFIPLGFSSWGTASALIAGIIAKEMIISSIAIFNNVNASSQNFMQSISSSLTLTTSAIFLTPASAASFMVFCLLYCPCISTVSVLKKEIGKKWTFISFVSQFFVAYCLSMITYFIFRITETYGILTVFIISLLLVILCITIIKTLNKKNKKLNILCSYCNRNCKIKDTYK